MDGNRTVLECFNKLPKSHTANILLVGMAGVGKHSLAKAIVDLHTSFAVHVRTATSLPLPATNAESRPRIDQVVFMVDVTNRHSMKILEASCSQLDVRYFIGRSCIVATNVTKAQERNVELELVKEHAAIYNCQLFCVDLESESSRKELSARLVHMLEVAGGFRPGISPLLLQATRSHHQDIAI